MAANEKSPLAETLRIRIVGGGMGGMAAALALSLAGFKDIELFEQASSLGEVGAGINSTPNLSRILEKFGVLDIAMDGATPVERAVVLDCATDEILSSVDYPYIEKEFGYPFYVMHRKQLQKSLVEGVKRSGNVKLNLGTAVIEYDFDGTRLKTRPAKEPDNAGEWHDADVILAADGIKSLARTTLLKRAGEEDHIIDTGQAAYRILVKRDQINEDPELTPFFDGSTSYRWIGHKRHIIAYPIDNHQIFNMSTAHPNSNLAKGPSTNWTTTGSKKEMLEVFKDFCPRVQKLLQTEKEEVVEWNLRVHEPLTHWTDGNIALIGDASHPTLPHLAQGAAQAVEDSAAIGVVISKIKSKSEIPAALKVYQELRKERCDWAVATAAANGRGLHLADGAERDKRNAAFKAASSAGGPNPDKAIDKEVQTKLYAHDPIADAERRYDQLFREASAVAS